MIEAVLAFAGRYQRMATFTSAIIVSTFTVYKAKVELFKYLSPPVTIGQEEDNRLRALREAPTSFFVEYREIKIESRSGNTFQMNSLVERNKQDVRMTWKDTATFSDIEGNLIPRNAPCQPSYPATKLERVDCELEGLTGWFQHQWWREVMPRKEGVTWEPWEYTQAVIPDGAHTMNLCSSQTIRVYEGFLGAVDKRQTICTDDYVLSDIPEK